MRGTPVLCKTCLQCYHRKKKNTEKNHTHLCHCLYTDRQSKWKYAYTVELGYAIGMRVHIHYRFTWLIVFSICTRPRLGKVVLINSTIVSRLSCWRINGLWLPRRLKATLKMTSDPWRNSMSGRFKYIDKVQFNPLHKFSLFMVLEVMCYYFK